MAANDWIRLNKGFITKPEVIRTAVALKVDKWRAACAWITILQWADDLTEDGFVPRMDGDAIDAIVELPGFFAIACAVEWMAAESGGVRFRNYTRYNTKSAKARSVDAKRQARKRVFGQNSDETRTELGHNSDETRTKVHATETETCTETESSESVNLSAQAQLPLVDAVASTHAVKQPKPEFSQRVQDIYAACTWKKTKPRKAMMAIQKAGRRILGRYYGQDDPGKLAADFLLDRARTYAKSPYATTTPKQYLSAPEAWFNGNCFDEDESEWNEPRKENANGTVNRSGRRADGTGTRPGEYEEPRLALRVLNADAP